MTHYNNAFVMFLPYHMNYLFNVVCLAFTIKYSIKSSGVLPSIQKNLTNIKTNITIVKLFDNVIAFSPILIINNVKIHGHQLCVFIVLTVYFIGFLY